MKNKIDSRTRADYLLMQGYSWMAGKWFQKGKGEVPDLRREVLVNPVYQCKEADDADKALAYFIGAYGDPRGRWPMMPIRREAVTFIGKCFADLPPMAYPLTEAELMIINRLLSGDDEMMFIATGCGGSGKSTFGNIVKQIFGDDFAALTLSELSDDFKLATAVGKRLIYSDELDTDNLKNNVAKMLISKQDVTINPKFGKPYLIRWQGELLFSCNKPPKLDITDSGLLRRICYFYKNTKIENPDPRLQKKTYTHDELVNFAAHAMALNCDHWFERYFMKDTHQAIRSASNIWMTRKAHEGDYRKYTYECARAGYKAYSQDKFESIWSIFQDWDKEEKEPLPDIKPF